MEINTVAMQQFQHSLDYNVNLFVGTRSRSIARAIISGAVATYFEVFLSKYPPCFCMCIQLHHLYEGSK